MADSPFLVSDISATDPSTSTYNVGDLRHGYNFNINDVSRLTRTRDPLFRLLSVYRKKTVTETPFKIVEERSFLHKRYAYPVAWRTWSGSGSVPLDTYSATADITTATPQTAGSYIAFKMGCDYKSDGNIANIFGQSTNEITIGDSGTAPIFFLPRQNVRINTKAAATNDNAVDYFTISVIDVEVSGNYAYVGGLVNRPIQTSTNSYLCSFTAASVPISETYTYAHGIRTGSSGATAALDAMKAWVQGNTYNDFTGVPGYYNTQPYTTRYGQNQITKHALGVSGRTLATEFKIVKNEFARRWAEVADEHNFVIGQDAYFSTLYTEPDGTPHTQGMVDFTLQYGNKFTMDTATSGSGYSQDDLLQDMTILKDPRYGTGIDDLLFAVPQQTWNWLHSLGGYSFNNMNLGLVSGSTTPAFAYQYDFAKVGPAKLADVDLFQFGTAHGKMNVVLDTHLNGTGIAMLAIPMSGINFCVLAGNGYNRDTTYYPNVQSTASNGIDGRVDLIMTDWGLEQTLPERWAVWTVA